MNLYRLLLFVTLAVHASGTSTQPQSSSSAADGAGVGSNTVVTNGPHRPSDASTSTSNIPPAVPAPARLEPFDSITQLDEGGPDNGNLEMNQPFGHNTHPRPRLPGRLAASVVKKVRACGRYILNNKMKCALYVTAIGCVGFTVAGLGVAIANAPDLYCPVGSTEVWDNVTWQDMCMNDTTGKLFPELVRPKKRGLEGSEKEEGKGQGQGKRNRNGEEKETCGAEWSGESCPCESATMTVGADGKITGVTDVKDVKHTKREVLKAVYRKRAI
ncbi:hypothetical protein C8R42DRAFT_639771 [Lentinula raphanica]|nr:hypothetical protein C8R42DRAFT_639771 [Lentinula raphanica]